MWILATVPQACRVIGRQVVTVAMPTAKDCVQMVERFFARWFGSPFDSAPQSALEAGRTFL
jgi:hypothetical protein